MTHTFDHQPVNGDRRRPHHHGHHECRNQEPVCWTITPGTSGAITPDTFTAGLVPPRQRPTSLTLCTELYNDSRANDPGGTTLSGIDGRQIPRRFLTLFLAF
jgi:hypothetical protein